ncbi:MAG: SLC13 family permease, partial [Verrucomicrobiales bacterium]|nr:SLC13 family permease [Verrucomicrobiales bacterium]
TERFRVDVVGMIGLLVLMMAGILSPEEAFAGLGSPTIVMLGAVFVVGGAMVESGVLDLVGGKLVKLLPRGEFWLVTGLMLVAAILSAFMNNTSVAAMLVPLVLGVARTARVSSSRLLIPVAFASVLGGTCTLIGTSTNLAVNAYLVKQAQLPPLGLFETTAPALVLVVAGILFMALFGRLLLPKSGVEELTDEFGVRGYLSEIVVLPGSPLLGQRVFESTLTGMEFRVLKIVREGRGFVPGADTVLEADDLLLVTGNVANLMQVKVTSGIEIRPELKWGDADLKKAGVDLAELVVSPRSSLIGRTLKEARFQQEFGLTVLAVYREGTTLWDRISRIPLEMGDLLLVQGRSEALENVRGRRDLAVLAERGSLPPRGRHPLRTLLIFGTAVLLGGFAWIPLSTAFLVAALAVVLTGCVRPLRIYDYVEWRLLILIGSMMGFGRAMQTTGAAEMLAQGVVSTVGTWGPEAVLTGFCLLTIVLTQPMSNAAAALVVLPVALESAARLGVSPRAFGIGVMLSASFSVATPLEPACVLVYGPGKYRFADFVKPGLPLTLLLLALLLVLLPVWWPLHE